MAMTVNGMKAAILAQWPGNISTKDELAQSLATAIVQYIQANAQVPATGLVAPAGGGAVTGTAGVT